MLSSVILNVCGSVFVPSVFVLSVCPGILTVCARVFVLSVCARVLHVHAQTFLCCYYITLETVGGYNDMI